MAKSSSLTLVVGVVGGALIGFLVAQVVPEKLGTTLDAQTQDDDAEQTSTPEALQGLDYLTLDERLRDELTSQGQLNGKDGSRFLRYGLSLEQDELIELSLSGALEGVVALYDDQLQLMESAETLRYRVEQAGDYVVVVSGYDASSYGPFTLYPRRIELSDSDTLSLGEPMDSWLQGSEHAVTLTIEEAGLYQIDMRSSDFDAYLVIEGPNGYLREDDDSGGDLDAQISDFLAPGDYTVKAQTYGDGSGIYTLTAETKELPGGELRNDGPIAPDESLGGWYSGQALEYELEIEEAGMYQIDMVSSDVDAFLELRGDNDYYREDDDGGDGLDARITDFLAPGVYQVTARTAYSSETAGLFTLSVGSNELPEGIELQNEGTLTAGESIAGWYSGEDVIYQLELEESTAVSIAMNSTDFDAYLELTGEGVSFADDDGGQGTNALLEASLLPGSYTVHARGYSAYGSGLFELEYRAEATDMQPDA
ncbi:hypothetical protein [Vreelandella sp. EE22]